MRRLEARGVSARAEALVILEGVDLSARGGEMLAVTGPSGAGKTTLLMILAGIRAPSAGTVLVDGRPLAELERPRERISVVLQNHGLVSALTALENVTLPLQARALEPGEVETRARRALSFLGLEESQERVVEDLSGGQQQRVGVARALAAEPELLIADEPTSELAVADRLKVLALLRERAEAGAIVVVASHDPDVVAACDHHLRLLGGRPQPD